MIPPLHPALAWAVVAAACWLSLTPQPPPPPDIGSVRADLLAHLAMHGGVASTLVLARVRAAAWIALALALYLEAAQLSAPGRDFDLADLAANLIGAWLGLRLAAAAARRAPTVSPQPVAPQLVAPQPVAFVAEPAQAGGPAPPLPPAGQGRVAGRAADKAR